MERQLLERMIGAGVLLVALVIIVPAILDGRPDVTDVPLPNSVERDVPEDSATPSRTHTFRLDSPSDSPPVARRTALPATPDSTPPAKTEPPVNPTPPPPAAQGQISSAAATTPVVKPAKPVPVRAAKPEPVTAAKALSQNTGWVVQLGSFSQQANAQRLADDTRSKGFPSFLVPLQRSGKTMYRVRVGPRESRGDAEKLATSLAAAGFKGQVVEQKPDN